MIRTTAILTLSLALGACAYAPPKPWEKGELAKPSMQFDAPAERQKKPKTDERQWSLF